VGRLARHDDDKVGNIQLTRIMGGDIRIDPAGFDIGIRDSWKEAVASVEAAGGKPYPIPAGASDHRLRPSPRWTSFANWAGELAAQEADLDAFFDTVIVCRDRFEPRRDDRRVRLGGS